jgi:hypothetical protein
LNRCSVAAFESCVDAATGTDKVVDSTTKRRGTAATKIPEFAFGAKRAVFAGKS